MDEFQFTDSNFQKEVLQVKGLVMVDFFAEWCGPCKMMGPAVSRLAKSYSGKVKIGKLNVDDNNETSGKYGIQSIPTTIFFREGKAVDTLVGFQSEEALKKKLDTL